MASDTRKIQEEEILSIGRELFSLKTKESVLLDEMNGKTGISAKLQDQLVESTKQLYDFDKKLSAMQKDGLLSAQERLKRLNTEGLLLKSQNDLAKLNLATYNKLNELNLAAYNKLNVAKTKSIGLLGSELQTTAGFITQIGKGLSMGITTFAGMATIAAGLLEIFIKSFEFFGNVYKSAQGIRDEFGFTRDMLPGIEKDISSMSTDMARLGVTAESATASYKAISNVSGVITSDMKAIARDSALFKQTMGATEITTAGIYEKLGASGDASEKTLQNTMLNVQQFAKMAGVAPTKIMVDIAKASGEIVSALRGSASELIKGAIAARMLGLDINKVGSAMRQLLNFGQSVHDEMEMSVLLGKNFNLNALRQAAWQGDAVKTAEEQVRLLKQMGGLQGKNMFQIDSMAKTLGLTVDDLQKMNQQQEMLAKASPEVRKGYEASMKAMKSGFDITHANRAEVDAHIKQLEKENQLQNDYTKMQNELKQALVDIYHVFEPIFKLAMMIVTPIAKTAHFLSTWGGFLDKIPGPLKLIISLMTIMQAKKFLIGGPGVMETAKGIWGWVKKIKEIIPSEGLLSKLKNIFPSDTAKSIKIQPRDALGRFAKKETADLSKGVAGKLKDKMVDKTSEGVSKGLSKLTKSKSKNIEPTVAPKTGMFDGITESVKKMDWKTMLGGAAVMLAFAAAIWILSKAVENFGKMDLKSFEQGMKGLSIAAGILVIGVGLIIAAAALLDAGVEVLVAAALILLAFGAALWVVSIAAMNFSKAITILFDAFKGLQDVDLLKIAVGLSALGLACYFAMPALILGSAALGMFTVAMLFAIPVMSAFTVSVVLLAGAIGLVGLALQPITSFFEIFNKTLTTLSGAVTTISSAFKETTQSLRELQDVDLFKIAKGIGALGLASFLSAGSIVAGAFALTMISVALKSISFAFSPIVDMFKSVSVIIKSISDSIVNATMAFTSMSDSISTTSSVISESVSSIVDSLYDLQDVDLFKIAKGIGALGLASFLSAGSIIAGAFALTMVSVALKTISIAFSPIVDLFKSVGTIIKSISESIINVTTFITSMSDSISTTASVISESVSSIVDSLYDLQGVDFKTIASGIKSVAIETMPLTIPLLAAGVALYAFSVAIETVAKNVGPIMRMFDGITDLVTTLSDASITFVVSFQSVTDTFYELQEVDFKKISTGLLEFGGAILTAAIPLIIGGKAIAMFNASVSFFASSFIRVSFAFQRMTDFFKTIKSMNISDTFTELAKSMELLGKVQLPSFEGKGGIMGFFGNMLSGDPIGNMVNSLNNLTGLSPDMSKLADTLSVIATSFSVFEQSDVISSGIDKITSSLVRMNEQLSKVSQNSGILENITDMSNSVSLPSTETSTDSDSNNSIIDAINNLIDAVTQQGQSQSDALKQIADVFGSGIDINNFDTMKFAKKMAVTSNRHGGTLAPV